MEFFYFRMMLTLDLNGNGTYFTISLLYTSPFTMFLELSSDKTMRKWKFHDFTIISRFGRLIEFSFVYHAFDEGMQILSMKNGDEIYHTSTLRLLELSDICI